MFRMALLPTTDRPAISSVQTGRAQLAQLYWPAEALALRSVSSSVNVHENGRATPINAGSMFAALIPVAVP